MKRMVILLIFLMMICVGSLSGCNESNENIKIENKPPIIADIEADILGYYENMSGYESTVNFQASAEDPDEPYENLTFHWDFGDGREGFSRWPTHTYRSIGNFTVRLIVEDKNGGSASDNITVNIEKIGLFITENNTNISYMLGGSTNLVYLSGFSFGYNSSLDELYINAYLTNIAGKKVYDIYIEYQFLDEENAPLVSAYYEKNYVDKDSEWLATTFFENRLEYNDIYYLRIFIFASTEL